MVSVRTTDSSQVWASSRSRSCSGTGTPKPVSSSSAAYGDSPTLPYEYVLDAFDCFETDDDVVIGPTEDGGYYLVGMRKLHNRIFEDIPWGGANALEATIERAKEAELDLTLLPEWRDWRKPDGNNLRARSSEG